jgi:integrase
MAIITLSETLLQRLSATDGRILRDRILCGFCLKANKRTRTFIVATSVNGKQFRMTLGRWPLLSVEEARSLAVKVLRDCRAGIVPERKITPSLPILRYAIKAYCEAKRLKPSSYKRYDSILRTHFGMWMDSSITELASKEFFETCNYFGQNNGSALVEVGRGIIGALMKYLNAVYGLNLVSPFGKLAAVGLLPTHSKPRLRRLKESDLPAWRVAVDKLPHKQRDFLLLTLFTGLRRNECANLTFEEVDFINGVITIPETKNGKVHTLPITPIMHDILISRCEGLRKGEKLFSGVSAEHLWEMAMRYGAPRFMLHDLRKLLATVGEKLTVSDTILRRILNHTAPNTDVLHKHYVSLDVMDISVSLERMQINLIQMMIAE